MNYLTALLAFSAIMIVLATLATVVVEGLHKLSRQRAKDFEEMLSNLYQHSIEPRLKAVDIKVSQDTKEFTAGIIKNPALRTKGKGFLRKIPIFKTDQEELSTLQFVEQFAQTQAGDALGAKSEKTRAEIISSIATEFERYGEAASSYFQRRATALSVMVAFGLALTLNIDAIKLYTALAKDTSLAENVISEIDIDALQRVYEQQIQEANDEAKLEKLNQNYQQVRNRIRADSETLEALDLPVGHAFFPYCNEDKSRFQRLAARPVEQTKNQEMPQMIDARCADLSAVVLSQAWADKLENYPIIANLLTFFKALFSRTGTVLTSQAGWAWLFSTLLAGGLIGLGAPFWFKTYRFMGNMIPGFKAGPTTQARADQDKVKNPTTVSKQQPLVVVVNGQTTPTSQTLTETTPGNSPTPMATNASQALSSSHLTRAYENARIST